MSWASATSPISSTTGPSLAAATPNADETVPSIPLAPRLESTRGAARRSAEEQLDVADRHRGRDEQGRVGAAATRSSRAATSGSESSSPSAAAIAALAASSAARQAASQSGFERRRGAPGSERRAGIAASSGDDRGRVLPRVLRIERDLGDVGERGEPRSQRLRGREVADAGCTSSGRGALGERPDRAAAGRSAAIAAGP